VAVHVGNHDPARQSGKVLPVGVREGGGQVLDPFGAACGDLLDELLGRRR
jgi:hypothetical protein